MMQKSKDLLNKLQLIAKEEGMINDEVIKFLNEIFADESEKVMAVIYKGIMKKVDPSSKREFWIAEGKEFEYFVYPKIYCSCQDFYKNVVVKKKKMYCKHILAQVVSEALKDYKTVKCDKEEFEVIMNNLASKFQ